MLIFSVLVLVHPGITRKLQWRILKIVNCPITGGENAEEQVDRDIVIVLGGRYHRGYVS